jgi:hypothetical protein
MCIYCGTKNYRKIYESHYGKIPKEDNGRSYEIHHIDGNRNNNSIDNLKLVTVQQHYNIHLSQGEWASCWKIAERMNISPEELSKIQSQLAIKNNAERVKNGTHNLLGPDSNKKRVANGTHHFLGPDSNKKRVANGTHPFIGGKYVRDSNKKMLEDGTHPFLNRDMAKERNKKRVENGTHPFVKQWTCEFCGKTGENIVNYNRWHGKKCKQYNTDP